MDQNHFRRNFKNKGQRGVDHAQEREPPLHDGEQRTQDVTARTQRDVRKRGGHLDYARIMIDLLKDPVSLGMSGRLRGYQR